MSNEALKLLKAGKGLSQLTSEEVTKMKETDLIYIYLLKKNRIIVGSIFLLIGLFSLFIGMGSITNIFGFYNPNEQAKEFLLSIGGLLFGFGVLLLMLAFRTMKNVNRIYDRQIMKEKKLLEGKR